MSEVTTTAVAKSVKSAKKAPKSAKKVAKKAAKVSKSRGESVRVRALKALTKADMTAPEIQAAIGLSHNLKPTMDQEVTRGHLSAAPANDNRGLITYHLTAAGRKAVTNGTVDPERAPRKPKATKPTKKAAKKVAK